MRLEYKRTHHITAYEANHLITEGTVDVLADDTEGKEHVIGRVSLDLLDYFKVHESEHSLFDVCDADSAGWENVYKLLFDPETDELHREIKCEDPFEFVVFAYNLVLLPVAKPFEPMILHHLARLNGPGTLFTMYQTLTDLPVRMLSELGFKKVAGSEVLFLPAIELTKVPDISTENLVLQTNVDYKNQINTGWDKQTWAEVFR